MGRPRKTENGKRDYFSPYPWQKRSSDGKVTPEQVTQLMTFWANQVRRKHYLTDCARLKGILEGLKERGQAVDGVLYTRAIKNYPKIPFLKCATEADAREMATSMSAEQADETIRAIEGMEDPCAPAKIVRDGICHLRYRLKKAKNPPPQRCLGAWRWMWPWRAPHQWLNDADVLLILRRRPTGLHFSCFLTVNLL